MDAAVGSDNQVIDDVLDGTRSAGEDASQLMATKSQN